MIDTLITNGFFEALIASCCGCTLSYIIKIKNNEKKALNFKQIAQSTADRNI